MATPGRSLTVTLLWVAVSAHAGDLQPLPASEGAFKNRILALIKPGQAVDDALKALAPYRFECREFQNKYPVIHCSYMENAPAGTRARYYQVLIEPTAGDRVKSVEPSVGMVRQ